MGLEGRWVVCGDGKWVYIHISIMVRYGLCHISDREREREERVALTSPQTIKALLRTLVTRRGRGLSIPPPPSDITPRHRCVV